MKNANMKYILAIAVLLGLVWLIYPQKSLTPLEKSARAAFTRSDRVSPLASKFSITIDGVDGVKATPEVTCGSRVKIEIDDSHPLSPQFVRHFLIVPRLPSQCEDGFHWQDNQVDVLLGPSSNTLKDRQSTGHTFKQKINWTPGQYVVRYYVQTFELRDGGMPNTEFMGEGHLVVLDPPADQHVESVTPLSDRTLLIPLLSKDQP